MVVVALHFTRCFVRAQAHVVAVAAAVQVEAAAAEVGPHSAVQAAEVARLLQSAQHEFFQRRSLHRHHVGVVALKAVAAVPAEGALQGA